MVPRLRLEIGLQVLRLEGIAVRGQDGVAHHAQQRLVVAVQHADEQDVAGEAEAALVAGPFQVKGRNGPLEPGLPVFHLDFGEPEALLRGNGFQTPGVRAARFAEIKHARDHPVERNRLQGIIIFPIREPSFIQDQFCAASGLVFPANQCHPLLHVQGLGIPDLRGLHHVRQAVLPVVEADHVQPVLPEAAGVRGIFIRIHRPVQAVRHVEKVRSGRRRGQQELEFLAFGHRRHPHGTVLASYTSAPLYQRLPAARSSIGRTSGRTFRMISLSPMTSRYRLSGWLT